MWGCTLLCAVGALVLAPALGVAALVVFVVGPLSCELRLRRVWRRLAAGGPAMKIGYELTEEGMMVSLAGVSTQHSWGSLRPLRKTASHWLFQGGLARRAIAVPVDAFSAEARTEVDCLFADLR